MKKLVIFIGAIAFFALAIHFTKKAERGASESASRAPAKVVDLNQQQAVMDEIATLITSIKTRAEIPGRAQKIRALAEKNKGMPGPQIISSLAELALPLEGIFWRGRKFVEKSDWLHASVLFRLRTFASYDYLYGTHVSALFDWLTQPPTTPALRSQFKTIGEFQDYLRSEAVAGDFEKREGGLEGLLKNLQALDQIHPDNFEFSIDRSIVTGVDENIHYIDKEEVKKRFIKPYLYTVTFLIERLLATIYYSATLNLDDLPTAASRILMRTAINSQKNRLKIEGWMTAKGVTSSMIFRTFDEFPRFLTLRLPKAEATQLLDRAFQLSKQAAQDQLFAYVCGITYAQRRIRDVRRGKECMERPEENFVRDGSEYLFNPNRMLIDGKAKYNAFRQRSQAFVKGDEFHGITSDVTGKTIFIRTRALFQPHDDLKAFFPKEYEAEGDPGHYENGTWVWNYHHGKPKEFKDPTFGGFFDSTKVRNGADVYRELTTLLYTDGIAPFAVFLRAPTPVRFLDLTPNR